MEKNVESLVFFAMIRHLICSLDAMIRSCVTILTYHNQPWLVRSSTVQKSGIREKGYERIAFEGVSKEELGLELPWSLESGDYCRNAAQSLAYLSDSSNT